ncbi:MAG: Hsp20/alpha crystallin family protein [Candidatus Nanopelagicales bacterium]
MSSVLRFDPFRDIDRLTEQLLGTQAGTARAPRFMPMDLFRAGDHFVLNADLPGVDPGSIDISVDNGTLTVKAERSERSEDNVQWIASERFTGTFMRQLALGEGIDDQGITARYDNGVLSLLLPVAEKAKPRKIELSGHDEPKVIETSSS